MKAVLAGVVSVTTGCLGSCKCIGVAQMTVPEAEAIDKSSSKSTTEKPGVERRSLLRALGVGTTLSLLGSGGVAATETTRKRDETQEIHPVFGLALTADEAVPDDVDPTQELELEVVEDENIHDGFPLTPDPEDPEQFVEADAEFFFDPVGRVLAPGDIVHFKNRRHLHTVTAFHEKFGDEEHPMPTRVPDGVNGFTSPPITADESWLYQFTENGVYDILCLPHLGFGMVVRIVVQDSGGGEELAAKPVEMVPPNAKTVLSAPELDPQHIIENESVGWSDLTLEMTEPSETVT